MAFDPSVNRNTNQVDDNGNVKVTEFVGKTIQAEPLAVTAVAAGGQAVSTPVNVASERVIQVFIDHARDSATAPTVAGTEYRIEAAQTAAGNDTWRTIYSFNCDLAAPSAIVTDALEAVGQTVIECGATGPAIGDIVFFKNATLANSEWSRVVDRVTTGGSESFTVLDGLTNAQAAGTYYNKAEQFVVKLDIATVTRIRVVANNTAPGGVAQPIVCRAACITGR